jgi:SIT family siderophore-iron:H+ symporter-like MFS transporter
MFCILVPVLAIPVMLTLGIGMRKGKNEERAHVVARNPDGSKKSLGQRLSLVLTQIDFIGLLLMVAGFGMLLTTRTIANGKGSHWSDGSFRLLRLFSLPPLAHTSTAACQRSVTLPAGS